MVSYSSWGIWCCGCEDIGADTSTSQFHNALSKTVVCPDSSVVERRLPDRRTPGSNPGTSIGLLGVSLSKILYKHCFAWYWFTQVNQEDGGDWRCVSVLYTEHVKEQVNSICKSREAVPGSMYPNSILRLSLPRPIQRELYRLHELLSHSM